MSDISDTKAKSRDRFKKLGKMAAEAADVVIFIGEHSYRGVKAARRFGMTPQSAMSFPEIFQASEYLKSELRKGDVVLLRGRSSDHLSRIYFAQLGEIGCWKSKCTKTIVCDLCDELKPDYDLAATLNRL
jgi:UDP-N-acetylmuramoyl-tripeptide--D-alanyl-D-alanine ligase